MLSTSTSTVAKNTCIVLTRTHSDPEDEFPNNNFPFFFSLSCDMIEGEKCKYFLLSVQHHVGVESVFQIFERAFVYFMDLARERALVLITEL